MKQMATVLPLYTLGFLFISPDLRDIYMSCVCVCVCMYVYICVYIYSLFVCFIAVVELAFILKAKPLVFVNTAFGEEDKDARFVRNRHTLILRISSWLQFRNLKLLSDLEKIKYLATFRQAEERAPWPAPPPAPPQSESSAHRAQPSPLLKASLQPPRLRQRHG